MTTIGLIQDLDLRDKSILGEHPRLVCGGLLHGSSIFDFSKLSEDDIKLHDGVRMFEGAVGRKQASEFQYPVHPNV